MQRKLVLAALMGFIGFTGYADTTLYLHNASGKSTPFALNNIKEITFPNGQINITLTDGSTTSITDSEFSSLSFTDSGAAGIDRVIADNDNDMTAAGTIYDIHGRRVAANAAALPAGVYILKSATNGSHKFLVK
jgi:hypothetical protein